MLPWYVGLSKCKLTSSEKKKDFHRKFLDPIRFCGKVFSTDLQEKLDSNVFGRKSYF